MTGDPPRTGPKQRQSKAKQNESPRAVYPGGPKHSQIMQRKAKEQNKQTKQRKEKTIDGSHADVTHMSSLIATMQSKANERAKQSKDGSYSGVTHMSSLI